MGALSLRQQTEGAMLAVVAVVISLATYLPVVGAFLLFAAPVPIILAVLRHGVKTGFLTCLLCTVLLLLFLGPLQALMFFIVSGSQGVLIGALVRWRLRPVRLLLAGMLVTVGIDAVSLHLSARMMGFESPLQDLRKSVDLMMDEFESMQKYLPAPPGDEAALQQEQMVVQMRRSMHAMIELPLLFFMAGAFGFVINYVISRWIIGRMESLGESLPPLPPFHSWRIPPAIALLMFVPFFILPPPATPEDFLASPLHFNLIMCVRLVFFIAGLAAATAYLRGNRVSTGMRIVAYVLMAGPLQNLVVLLGVADSLVGLRDNPLFGGSHADRECGDEKGPSPGNARDKAGADAARGGANAMAGTEKQPF